MQIMTPSSRLIRATLLATVLTGALALPALADPASPPVLTVSGEGSASAAPDIAVVSLGVVSEADTAQAALAANAKDMNAVVDTITGTGIEKKDVATSGLFVEPVYSDPAKDPSGQSTITGYRVSNQLSVRIRDIAKSGPLLDKVISAGANRVNGISFEIAKSEGLRDAAIKAAIAEARRRAEIMAEAAGVKLGPIQSISANEGGGPPVFRAMAMKDAMPPSPSPVMGGTQEISANATIVYAISPR
ncbi:MAG TPA: SIMPL domain-containing protein [Kaistia sp.]|nr:SIMPL domain-containing protein [Kaistia sp.]